MLQQTATHDRTAIRLPEYLPHQPLYQRENGQIAEDLSRLLEAHPRTFSLAKLALYLSYPALFGEFVPDTPWTGITRLRTWKPWPDQSTSSDRIVAAFQHSVWECICDAHTVAIALSGGLDSFAVLYHTILLAQQTKEIIAFTADMQDDTGQSNVAIIQKLLRQCHLDVPLSIVTRDHLSDHLPWNPSQPMTAAMPQYTEAFNRLAKESHADVLLTGNGADELLGAVRFLAPVYVRGHQWKDLAQYIRDIALGGFRRLSLEIAAACANYLHPTLSAQCYWAMSWPELSLPQVPSILAKPYRSAVAEWTRSWIQQIVQFHAAHHSNWATIDAWDSLFPFDAIPASGAIPEYAPFLQPSFARYAMSIPLNERYVPSFPTAYQRRKALVMQLFPPELHQYLPLQKQLYSQAYTTTQHHQPCSITRCIALGLIDESEFAQCTDPTIVHMVHALEHWIREAERQGATAIEE